MASSQKIYNFLSFARNMDKNFGKNISNKFKISALTWNKEFELLDGSYSISDIQGYFEYIFKKRGEKTVNPSIKFLQNAPS